MILEHQILKHRDTDETQYLLGRTLIILIIQVLTKMYLRCLFFFRKYIALHILFTIYHYHINDICRPGTVSNWSRSSSSSPAVYGSQAPSYLSSNCCFKLFLKQVHIMIFLLCYQSHFIPVDLCKPHWSSYIKVYIFHPSWEAFSSSEIFDWITRYDHQWT